MPLKDSAVLYYIFYFLYAGHPAHILQQFWLALDAERTQDHNNPTISPWKALDDGLKESYRATGVMGALVASAAAALIATPYVSAHSATLVLLLASLTCSLASVAAAASFLGSATYANPHDLKHAWDEHGLIFFIMLSTPMAWLRHALLTLQGALLSLVWLSKFAAAQIVITILIGLRLALGFAIEISFVGIEDTLLGLLGNRKHLNHNLIIATDQAIKKRHGDRDAHAAGPVSFFQHIAAATARNFDEDLEVAVTSYSANGSRRQVFSDDDPDIIEGRPMKDE